MAKTVNNKTKPQLDQNAMASNLSSAANAYNEEQARKKQAVANIDNYMANNWLAGNNLFSPNMPEKRQTTAASAVYDNNPYSKTKIEETIWGNNYYYPNGQLTAQWEQNALNWTWHVAWIPEWPQMWWLNLLWENSAPVEQVTAPVQETPKTTVSWTKQPSVSTPQNTTSENVQLWYSPDIVNATWPIWVQQEAEQPTNNNNEQALADMENDLQQQGSTIYGRSQADVNTPTSWIQTLTDQYSAQAAANQSRISNLKYLQAMNSEDIATSITWWYTPYGDQAMRDLMQYNPEKYAEVQQFITQQKWQNSINSITTGDVSGMNTTQTAIDNVNNWVDSWADGLSSSPQQAWQLVTNISSSMTNNWVATTATQEMLNLNAQMADIQEKMANVKKEAQKAFKWDVPQYIVDAYANNRLQEYQSQYNKLESRYNAAMDLYKTELDNAKRQAEMDLKKAQFQQNIDNETRDRYYKSQQLLQSNIKRVNGAAYQVDPTTWTYVKLTDETATIAYQSDVNKLMQWWTSMHYDWQYVGYQCEQFTDNFTEASVGIRMTWASPNWWTTAAEKLSYVNDYTPQVWSVVVAAWWAYDSTYWHTMLITWYDPTTWLVDLMWANSNWDNTIHTSTTTMDDIRRNSQAMGIRNPYLTKAAQSVQQWWTWTYSYYSWPMQSFFEEAYENATVASERADIKAAQDSYAIINELVETWTIDKIANSDEFNVLLSEISNGKFVDSNWNINFDKITKYVRNKLKDEDIAYWMDRLRRLIEKKLRKESWAAISMSEWNSNFDMYLPNVWQSPEYRYKRLQALERDIVAEQLPPKYRANYIPVIWVSTVREIR